VQRQHSCIVSVVNHATFRTRVELNSKASGSLTKHVFYLLGLHVLGTYIPKLCLQCKSIWHEHFCIDAEIHM